MTTPRVQAWRLSSCTGQRWGSLNGMWARQTTTSPLRAVRGCCCLPDWCRLATRVGSDLDTPQTTVDLIMHAHTPDLLLSQRPSHPTPTLIQAADVMHLLQVSSVVLTQPHAHYGIVCPQEASTNHHPQRCK